MVNGVKRSKGRIDRRDAAAKRAKRGTASKKKSGMTLSKRAVTARTTARPRPASGLKKASRSSLRISVPASKPSSRVATNRANRANDDTRKKYMMPRVGDSAPDFSLPDANGSLRGLAEYRGRYVVLYFYPKDDTPGCTIEAQGFRDDHDLFIAKNAVVMGVSKDTCESHRAFMQKHGLRSIFLSDVTGEVVARYGCWVEKSMYGRKYMGIARATFIIDPTGRISRVFPNVSPNGHSEDVLRALP